MDFIGNLTHMFWLHFHIIHEDVVLKEVFVGQKYYQGLFFPCKPENCISQVERGSGKFTWNFKLGLCLRICELCMHFVLKVYVLWISSV